MACGLSFRRVVRIGMKRTGCGSQSTFGMGWDRRPGPPFSILFFILTLSEPGGY